jgi:hypothetical protein
VSDPSETVEDIERVILRAIEKYARGNPPALARDIIAALGRAGFIIVPRQDDSGAKQQ